MSRARKVIFLITTFILISSFNIKAERVNLSGSQIFLKDDIGKLWETEYNFDKYQGISIDYLIIDDYFQQWGFDYKSLLSKTPGNKLFGTLGWRQYQLFGQPNGMFKMGIESRAPFYNHQLRLDFDLAMDDKVGLYLTHKAELILFHSSWLKGKVGYGNLLGGKDGSSFWLGLEF